MDESRTSGSLADEFRVLICTRIGCRPGDLSCPHARSDDTPCVARDGGLAVAEGKPDDVCAGCNIPVRDLMARERARDEPPPVDE